MASVPHSTLALGGASASASASDYLRSSRSGFSGIPLRTLGRTIFTTRKRDLTVTAALFGKGKGRKKYRTSWPDDPNVKGGVLSHLSSFKPLAEPPKPVVLEFEKPFLHIAKKIAEVKKLANETGVSCTEEVNALQEKYNQRWGEVYSQLTPIQRVNIARHPNRPTFLDHIFNITEKFVELHGDRAGYDDPAIVTGIGTIDGQRYMFIGHQKGRNTKEHIKRNFGMPTPHGYRKALRMMYYADHHGFPIVTFIDTPGAFADLQCEHKGQGEAIAHNLRTMFGLKVPIISFVIGEGGSGGALAIGCANKLLMLENGVFFVASPEACAAILYKNSNEAPRAAKKLRITSHELVKLNIADGIIPEPLGGAHADPLWASQQIKIAINENMAELSKMSGEELVKHRMNKHRHIGKFGEGVPIDRKFNMKKRDAVIPDAVILEGEIEKVKEQILKAKETQILKAKKTPSEEQILKAMEIPSKEDEPSSEVLYEMIERLKSFVNAEYTEAARAVGLEEKLTAVRKEFLKGSSEDLIEKMEKFKEEFNARLSDAPNYERLKSKLKMLRVSSRAKAASDAAWLRKEINKRLQEVPEVTEKFEAVKAMVASSGASSFDELSDELKEKALKTKGEVDEELKGVLKSMGLELEALKRELKQDFFNLEFLYERLERVNQEIGETIEFMLKTPRMKRQVELLKEVTKLARRPDAGRKAKRLERKFEQHIKQRIKATLTALGLVELREGFQKEIEKLEQEIKPKKFKALRMSGLQKLEKEIIAALGEVAAEESNGSLKEDEDDGSGSGKPEIVNPKFV